MPDPPETIEPFVPLLSGAGIEPLVLAVKESITARAAAALAWASPDEALSDFKAVHLSEHGRVDTQFPVLAVMGIQTLEDLAADNASEKPTHTIQVEIAVSGVDKNLLAQHIYRYARAVKAIILAMTKQDWMQFYPVGTQIGGMAWQVTEIDYGALLRHRTTSIYRLDCALTVAVQTFER